MWGRPQAVLTDAAVMQMRGWLALLPEPTSDCDDSLVKLGQECASLTPDVLALVLE